MPNLSVLTSPVVKQLVILGSFLHDGIVLLNNFKPCHFKPWPCTLAKTGSPRRKRYFSQGYVLLGSFQVDVKASGLRGNGNFSLFLTENFRS